MPSLQQPNETDRACRYREGYTSSLDDTEATARIVTVLNNANTRQEMDQLALMYIMDINYSRKDISYAIGYTERNKEFK